MLASLFFTFVRIGVFTFGGGYAMLPMLQRELVDNKEWITEDNLMDYYSIGQCTPGVIAVNTATFVGYRLGKIKGALTATAGVITPSLLIIMLISALLNNFADIPLVQHAFSGIRIAVCALVLRTIISLFRRSVKDPICVLIASLTFISIALLKWSPIVAVFLAAISGILIHRKEDANK